MIVPEAIEQQYAKHSKFQPYPADGNLNEYNATLPRFQGKTLFQHIRERVTQGQTPIRVLDIGCGKGIFLCELVSRFPQIKASGISAFDYREILEDPWFTYIQRVDYRVGNAYNLREIFNDVRFDVITSMYTLQYLPNPTAVVEQAYTLLNTGGVAFLDNGLLLHRAP